MRSTVSGPMISDARKPPDACQAMWQWKAQMPVVAMLVSISSLGLLTYTRYTRVPMYAEEERQE